MLINFKVNKTADSGNIAANDHSGIVNGSYSFLKIFDVKLNSKSVELNLEIEFDGNLIWQDADKFK